MGRPPTVAYILTGHVALEDEKTVILIDVAASIFLRCDRRAERRNQGHRAIDLLLVVAVLAQTDVRPRIVVTDDV